MAHIYQKYISAGVNDNCLILDPREALVMPFSISGGWNKILVSIKWGFVSRTGDNLGPAESTDAYTNQTLTISNLNRNRIFLGFTDRDGFAGEDANFIGFATVNSQARYQNDNGDEAFLGSSDTNYAPSRVTIATGNVVNKIESIAPYYYRNSRSNQMSNTTTYSSCFNLYFEAQSNSGSGFALEMRNSWNDGYYSSGAYHGKAFTSASYVMGALSGNSNFTDSRPCDMKNLFFYIPFSNARLRIDTVAIYKLN